MSTQPNYTYRDYDYPINLLLDLRMEKSIPGVLTVLEDEYLEMLDGVLATIPESIKTALLHRYKEQMTLEEIGDRLDVSSERARQIVVKGLRLLRHPSRRKYLTVKNGEPGRAAVEAQNDGPQVLELDLSSRVKNLLLRGGMWTIGEVAKCSPEELGQIRGIGVASYTEIIACLEVLGFDMSAYRGYMENWTYA